MDPIHERDRRSQASLLEQLTGIRSSKRTHYRDFREKARRLDHAITSIATIAAALANTTSGVAAVAGAVARAAAQHFEADAAIVLLDGSVAQHWTAQHAGEAYVVVEQGVVPAPLAAVVRAVQAEQRLVRHAEQPDRDDPAQTVIGVPMLLSDRIIGVIAVAPGLPIDDDELLVLHTVASQAAVAIASAQRYEASERLRVEATELYEATSRQKSELEAKNRELEHTARQLQVARYQEIVNAERNRIARELHDSVAQYLLSIGMNLEWCRAQLDPDDVALAPIYERIGVTKELARSAVGHMRSAIFELSSIDISQMGLLDALHSFAGEFQRLTAIAVRIRRTGAPCALPLEVEHTLYRIAQEALFNAYKHAQEAKICTVTVRFAPDALLLLVCDDGVGITEEQLRALETDRDRAGTAHYGLQNMRTRAQEVGGTCVIRRRRSGGTEVRVYVPIRRRDGVTG